MFDNLDPTERRGDKPAPDTRDGAASRPIADREVPLSGNPMSPAVHAWLDGELPVGAARHADTARDVDFWLRIEREVEVRRSMKTPVHVYGEIMAALPQSVPNAVPWWRRRFTTTPLTAMAIGFAVLAAGAAITALVLLAR
jgi:hypothetical protein